MQHEIGPFRRDEPQDRAGVFAKSLVGDKRHGHGLWRCRPWPQEAAPRRRSGQRQARREASKCPSLSPKVLQSRIQSMNRAHESSQRLHNNGCRITFKHEVKGSQRKIGRTPRRPGVIRPRNPFGAGPARSVPAPVRVTRRLAGPSIAAAARRPYRRCACRSSGRG
jgi:hypothetical protein